MHVCWYKSRVMTWGISEESQGLHVVNAPSQQLQQRWWRLVYVEIYFPASACRYMYVGTSHTPGHTSDTLNSNSWVLWSDIPVSRLLCLAHHTLSLSLAAQRAKRVIYFHCLTFTMTWGARRPNDSQRTSLILSTILKRAASQWVSAKYGHSALSAVDAGCFWADSLTLTTSVQVIQQHPLTIIIVVQYCTRCPFRCPLHRVSARAVVGIQLWTSSDISN